MDFPIHGGVASVCEEAGHYQASLEGAPYAIRGEWCGNIDTAVGSMLESAVKTINSIECARHDERVAYKKAQGSEASIRMLSEELERRCLALTEERAGLLRELKGFREALNKARAERDEKAGLYCRSEAMLGVATWQIGVLGDSLKEERSNVAELAKRNADLCAENDNLSAELDRAKEEIDEKDDEISRLDGFIEEVGKKVQELYNRMFGITLRIHCDSGAFSKAMEMMADQTKAVTEKLRLKGVYR